MQSPVLDAAPMKKPIPAKRGLSWTRTPRQVTYPMV